MKVKKVRLIKNRQSIRLTLTFRWPSDFEAFKRHLSVAQSAHELMEEIERQDRTQPDR